MATLNTAALLNPTGSDPNASKTPTPTLVITGEMGRYSAAIDGTPLGEFQPYDPYGHYHVVIVNPLADGPHLFTFDELTPHPGGPPGFPPQPYNFSIDTRPPTAPVLKSAVAGPQNAQGYAAINAAGTLTPGETVKNIQLKTGPYRVLGGSGNPPTNWTLQTVPIAPGKYDVYVVALDQAGNVSLPSNSITVQIGTTPPPVTTPPSAPTQPGSSTVTAISSATITWTAPADGGSPITSYRIYRDSILLGSASSTARSFTDNSPKQGAQYTVSAINAIGEGPQSPAVVPWP